MATAYIEITIPSLYTGRPAQRLVEAARQNLTRIMITEAYMTIVEKVRSQKEAVAARHDFDVVRIRLNFEPPIPPQIP